MTELTYKDYTHILEYYKQNIPKSKRMLKLNAEKILSEKLCKCIKKIEPKNEAKSIGICTKTILNRKGLTRGKFNCKVNQKITLKKLKNKKTQKNKY